MTPEADFTLKKNGGQQPVISVDTKKREQLGRLPMGGREWRPKGEPVQVEDHSFFCRTPTLVATDHKAGVNPGRQA
jgi:hypothetical protein